MQHDTQGRLFSETTSVWFTLSKDKRDLLLIDATTGEKLLTDEEEHEARLRAEARAALEAQRANAAEVARLRALLDKRNGGLEDRRPT